MESKKKRISIIFLIVVGILLIINLVFFSGNHKAKENTKDEPKEVKVEESKAKEKKDPLEETKKATTNLYREKITPVGSGKEYPSSKTGILKDELLQLAKEGKYGDLLTKANKVTEEYKFSKGDNLDIAGIIYDAGIIADIFDKEKDPKKYGETIATSKTPEMLIASTMFSDNFQRRPVLQDVTSLAPVGFESFVMESRRAFSTPEKAEDEPLYADRNVVEDIFTFNENVNEVFAFDITIPSLEDLPLTAYVWEDLYGNLKFHGMYAPDDFKTYEHNLEWWMQQDVLYDSAEKEQEKNYEDNAKKGVITEEQVDKLFESDY